MAIGPLLVQAREEDNLLGRATGVGDVAVCERTGGRGGGLRVLAGAVEGGVCGLEGAGEAGEAGAAAGEGWLELSAGGNMKTELGYEMGCLDVGKDCHD